MLTGGSRVSAPYPCQDQPLLAFNLPHQDIVRILGEAHGVSGPPEDAGPCEYWAFQFACGLVAVIRCHLVRPSGEICASAPEIDHVLQHVPIGRHVTWRLDTEEPELFASRYGDSLVFSVVRQDDNGSRSTMARFDSQQAAECYCRNFERLAHKQTYWVERRA